MGWHELMTTDWEAGLAFYGELFGWQKADAMDMGPMGTYQLFADSREKDCGAVGGMMNLLPNLPRPVWGFYFIVDAIDPAVERVKEGGGQVLNGPMEVPGGAWIINAVDPQGAHFSLVGAKR
jgi:predicted enzyme related to lactoylglutathione lyase